MNSFYGSCLEQLITKRARMNVLVARGNCFCCCYFVVVVVVVVVVIVVVFFSGLGQIWNKLEILTFFRKLREKTIKVLQLREAEKISGSIYKSRNS